MKRNCKLEFRVSEEELKIIEENARNANLNTSQFIRSRVLSDTAFVTNAKDMIPILFYIQTNANQAMHSDDPEIQIRNIITRADKLWPFLR